MRQLTRGGGIGPQLGLKLFDAPQKRLLRHDAAKDRNLKRAAPSFLRGLMGCASLRLALFA